MSNSPNAIFLSYASQDADAARRICEALRAAGLEVWFDQSELRGGDAWDQSIRKQIKECSLFVPVISANTNAREEGYFRLEWKLAVDRSHLMADDKAFFFPVVIGDVVEASARVPEKFRERQWTRLNGDASITAFAERIAKVQAGGAVSSKSASKRPSDGEFDAQNDHQKTRHSREGGNPAHRSSNQLERKDWVPASLPNPAGATTQEQPNLGPGLRRDDGLESGASNNRVSSPPPKRINRIAAIATALILLIAAAFGINHFRTTSSTTPNEINSIAVLPFQLPVTTDADTDYLSVGLAETLIYQLSRLPKLKVSPASSVYRYKGKEVDPLKVGSELNVAAVMTGRLVQRGESLSISVELVDVRNNKSLWGEKYERRMADLLATQRDIASEITRTLQLNLTGESKQLLAKRFTDNNEAYQLYLKGQYLYAKRGKDNLLRAVDFYRQAVTLDPNFANAYVALADAYSIGAFNNNWTSREVLPLAAAAAERALTLDAALAEAHAAKASVAALDWRWEDARRGFTRALELNPNVAETHFRYGLMYLNRMGRHEEAVAEIKRATELEPQAIVMAAVLTRAYAAAGKTQLALDNARKVYALEPEHPSAVYWLMVAESGVGNYNEALALIAKMRSQGVAWDSAAWAVDAYMKMGRPNDAKREAETLIAATKEGALHYDAALAAAAIGNRDQAFALLDKAFAARESRLVNLHSDTLTLPLRDDPRFASLVKRMGLPL